MNLKLPLGKPTGKPLNLARSPKERKKVGKLEIAVNGKVEESLQVRRYMDGEIGYKITGKANSLTEGTDIAWREYRNPDEMKDYVQRQARKKYQSWFGRMVNYPPVEVSYHTNRQLLERDMRRLEERDALGEAV